MSKLLRTILKQYISGDAESAHEPVGGETIDGRAEGICSKKTSHVVSSSL